LLFISEKGCSLTSVLVRTNKIEKNGTKKDEKKTLLINL
jgi:hypothetical protein